MSAGASCPLISYTYQELSCSRVLLVWNVSFDSWIIAPHSSVPLFMELGSNYAVEASREFNETLQWLVMPVNPRGCAPIGMSITLGEDALRDCYTPHSFEIDFSRSSALSLTLVWSFLAWVMLLGVWHGVWERHVYLGTMYHILFIFSAYVVSVLSGVSDLLFGNLLGCCAAVVSLAMQALYHWMVNGSLYTELPTESFKKKAVYQFLVYSVFLSFIMSSVQSMYTLFQ
jgi:hypothetical protein